MLRAATCMATLLLAATLLAFTSSCSSARAAEPPAAISEVLLPGAPDHGIFDPSIAADDTGTIYMSLSGVGSTAARTGVGSLAVSTYLAASSDQGKQWRILARINPSVAVALRSAPSPHRGMWQNEVSALVFDRYAIPAARWKLFWHQYLNVNGVRRFQHGWIAYKEAPSPAELAGARPTKLMTGRAYDPVDDDAAGWTHPAIAGPPRLSLADLSRELSRCVAVTEPGVLAKSEGVYLSLVCIRGSPFGLLGFSNSVILLKCTRPCRAAARWSYLGTALTQADAGTLGMDKFSASDMFSTGGHDFITVSPVGSVPVPDSYKGCTVFEFADLSRAHILRNAAGRAQVQAHEELGPAAFNGACSFLPAKVNPGLLIGRVEGLERSRVIEATFHIYRTPVRP